MKISIPAIQISNDEGFTRNDIFSRKDFGERLANLISGSREDLVVALDADWGEGKSTFIKMGIPGIPGTVYLLKIHQDPN